MENRQLVNINHLEQVALQGANYTSEKMTELTGAMVASFKEVNTALNDKQEKLPGNTGQLLSYIDNNKVGPVDPEDIYLVKLTQSDYNEILQLFAE